MNSPAAPAATDTTDTDTTNNTNNDTPSGADVKGASTEKDSKVLGETSETKNGNDTFFGLAWYWWIPIAIVALGLLWWLIAALRRRQDYDT